MSSVEQLLRLDPSSALLSFEVGAPVAAEHALGWSDAALTIRAIRGRKARTVPALFDEFAAALQFPYYFGENWSAFDECIADLDWLPAQAGIAVLIYEAGQVLADDTQEDLAVLVKVFAQAAATFGQPVEDGEWWDRPALPFHFVLQEERLQSLFRWEAAGARIAPIEPLGLISPGQ